MPEPDFVVKSMVSLSELWNTCVPFPATAEYTTKVPQQERNLFASSSERTRTMQARLAAAVATEHWKTCTKLLVLLS